MINSCDRERTGEMCGKHGRYAGFVCCLSMMISMTFVWPSGAETTAANGSEEVAETNVKMETEIPIGQGSQLGTEIQTGEGYWSYQAGEGGLKGIGTKEQPGCWYHCNVTGKADTGWKFIDRNWFFFYPVEGEEKGRMLDGWQWIDGRCYYLAEQRWGELPLGAMYTAGLTPDGYFVGENGVWQDENGAEQYMQGKGVCTTDDGSRVKRDNEQAYDEQTGSSRRHRGSGGGSGGGGGNHGGRADSEAGETGDSAEPLQPEEPSNSEEYVRPEEHEDTEEHADAEEYGEKEEKSHSEETWSRSTPSDVVMVNWEVRFVEEGNPDKAVLKTQIGNCEEETELWIDFPEIIMGEDGYQYESLVNSPLKLHVFGNGVQKYQIQFKRGGKAIVEPDAEAEQKQLTEWINTVKRSDREITGRPLENDWPIVTASQEESRERLKNLVSMVHDAKNHEIYLIAKDHSPSTLVIAEAFPDTVEIKGLLMDEFMVSEAGYCVLRISFKRTWDKDTCVHEMEVYEHVPAGCLSAGHDTRRCRICGDEETLLIPPAGHRDTGGDGICNVCGQPVEQGELPEELHYQLGDAQMRTIAGRDYCFRCIDEDYKDGKGNSQPAALFLCDSVIRSDVDRSTETYQKMSFGGSNNYKNSNIRAWLIKNAGTDFPDCISTYTGITTAYRGATKQGSFEQFSHRDLEEYDKPFQLMEDTIFIPSMEEADRYREYLWKFNGSEENNPDSQYSPYSRGYFLRTPEYFGENQYKYESGIYVVDLLEGNIHPVAVSDTDIGIRPILAVRQH